MLGTTRTPTRAIVTRTNDKIHPGNDRTMLVLVLCDESKFGCHTNVKGSYKARDIDAGLIAQLEHRVSLLEQNTMKFREEVIE
jgi:hypothetical protein